MPASSWIRSWSSVHLEQISHTCMVWIVGPYSYLKVCQLRLILSLLPLLKLNYLLRKTDWTFIIYAILGFLSYATAQREQNTKKVRSDRAKGKNQPGALDALKKVGGVRQDAVVEFVRQLDMPTGESTRGRETAQQPAGGQQSFACLCWRWSG